MYLRFGIIWQTDDKRTVTTRAFTLVEVLVALTIGSLLVMSVVSATRAMSNSRGRVEERITRSASARSAMEAIVGTLRNVRRFAIADKPTIIGHQVDSEDGDRINLHVISDRRVRTDGAESDQYEVSFYLEQLEGRAWPSLICRKDHGLDEEEEEGGMATVVADGIVGLTFDYLRSDDQWEEQWSEIEQNAPEAVRVTVTAIDTSLQESIAQPEVTMLSTVVAIHTSKVGQQDQQGQQGQQGQQSQQGNRTNQQQQSSSGGGR